MECMSQATLDDDELFDEAASEMREDVESSLDDARAALPESDDIWDAEADNTLGVLNGLKEGLDAGDAESHLRDAKKWYAVGTEAGAFDDADDLKAAIADLEGVVEGIAEAHDQVGDLTATIPELRGSLDEANDD